MKETQVGLQGHKGSIEDIQFSPEHENVLATCSCDQTIKLWDLRATQQKPTLSFIASDCDINVMSWNSQIKFLLASGDDKGEFRVWDLRMVKQAASSLSKGQTYKDAQSITRIRWHTKPITSIQFEPREDSVLAVASDDDKLTWWYFSVEVDESETVQDQDMDVPPQLMFVHQGQKLMKEIRFHPQFRSLLVSTASDSFNVLRPNFDPDEDQPAGIEESKDNTTESSSVQPVKNTTEHWADSEEDEEEEERRVLRTVRALNRNRANRSKSKGKDGKR